MTEQDNCTGGCRTTETTTNGKKAVEVTCSSTKNLYARDCVETVEDKRICYCYTDLCNTGSIPDFGGDGRLKCHHTIPGYPATRMDCNGTCSTLTIDKKLVIYGCSDLANNTCIEEENQQMCYCNTNLCNWVGGKEPEHNGSSALKVTWVATWIVTIVMAVGRVVI